MTDQTDRYQVTERNIQYLGLSLNCIYRSVTWINFHSLLTDRNTETGSEPLPKKQDSFVCYWVCECVIWPGVHLLAASQSSCECVCDSCCHRPCPSLCVSLCLWKVWRRRSQSTRCSLRHHQRYCAHAHKDTKTVSVINTHHCSFVLCCQKLTWYQLQGLSSHPFSLKHSPNHDTLAGKSSEYISLVTQVLSVLVFIHGVGQVLHDAPDVSVRLYFGGTESVVLPLSFFFIFLWRVPWRRYDRIWVSFEITMSLVVRVVWAWNTTASQLKWDKSLKQHSDIT